jgi:hypothetical protein
VRGDLCIADVVFGSSLNHVRHKILAVGLPFETPGRSLGYKACLTSKSFSPFHQFPGVDLVCSGLLYQLVHWSSKNPHSDLGYDRETLRAVSESTLGERLHDRRDPRMLDACCSYRQCRTTCL